jgi:hypothetical protein
MVITVYGIAQEPHTIVTFPEFIQASEIFAIATMDVNRLSLGFIHAEHDDFLSGVV